MDKTQAPEIHARGNGSNGTDTLTLPTAAPIPTPRPLSVAPDSPERFINRELSWLDFNHRVVEEAENPRHPLLERVRFVSISASNLDEFYSVRVAGLIGQAKAGVTALSPDGRTAAQQLAEIKKRAETLLADQQHAWRDLRGLLQTAGIEVCDTGLSRRRRGLAGGVVHGAGFSPSSRRWPSTRRTRSRSSRTWAW